MALDTRSKRASSVQILAPWMLAPVLPDGTISQADRQHIAWSYSGIAAGVPASAVVSIGPDLRVAGLLLPDVEVIEENVPDLRVTGNLIPGLRVTKEI